MKNNNKHISRKIVILDDEEIIVNLLKDALEEEDFKLYTTCDEDEAIQLVKEHDPHICLLDMKMPHKTGIEVLREIRSFNTTVRVFFVSAYTSDDCLEKAKDLNVEDVIPKGTSLTVLKSKIFEAFK